MKDITSSMKEKLGIETNSIKFFASGIINNNYLVNEKYLYRKKRSANNFNDNSENEVDAEAKLKGTNITIPYLYIDSKIKITEFIPNSVDLSYFVSIDNDALISIANKLRELHSYHFKTKSDFRPFARLEEYYFNAHAPKFPLHDEIVERVKKYYKNQTLFLCHNDLVPGNILYHDHQFYLIDFEYASNNLPFFDIASFLMSNNIEEKSKQDLFINTYYQSCQPKNIEQMRIDFFEFYDLLWYYWSITMYRQTKDLFYLDKGKAHAARLVKYTKVQFNIEDINY